MARKTKTATTPLEQISSDLKLAESKKHELSRACQDLQSLSSSIFTLTVQWQDLQSDFDAIEASLKNGIQELESKEKEVARKVQSVEDRINNLEAREGEFAVRSSKLEARELEDSEREFAIRFGKLEDSEREFAVRSSKLEDSERRVKSLEKEVARKEQSVEARIKNFEARKSEFAVRFGTLEDSEREFAVRSIKMEYCEFRVKNLEKEVARKEQSVEARIENVEARELEFAVRFSKLEDSEREFAVRFSKLENIEREFAVRFSKLENIEREFAVRSNKMEYCELQVKNLEKEVARKEQSIEARIKNVEARKSEFAARSSILDARERRVKSLEKEVAREEQSVEARKSEFAVQFGQLEDIDREVAVRFSKLEDCEAPFMSLENWNAPEFDRIAWTPPLEDFVKVNFDGSFISKDQLGGLGVVVRDKNGKVIAARARKTLGVLKSNIVELLAAKEALNLVSSLGFKKIVVEGDCLSAINLLLGKTKPKKDENAIALDAFCLASGFTSCLFTHVKREGNKVADGISKFATKIDSVEEWKEDLPSWLSISSELDIRGIAENRATMQFDFPGNVNDQQYQCPGTQASMDHDGSSNLSVPYLQDAAAAPGYYNTPTSGSVYGLPPQKSVDIHCFDLEEWIRSLVSWIIKLVLFCLFFLFFVFRFLVGSALSKLTN